MRHLLFMVCDAIRCSYSPNLHNGPECELSRELWKLLSPENNLSKVSINRELGF